MGIEKKHTVCLLSFRAGIIKSICVKEMTLSLFSFRHTSLLTVHTDLHGHTASGYLCRSRPLQWCLMYLSRLSGCPKSSQRHAPSSRSSLLGTNVFSTKLQSAAWIGETSPRPKKLQFQKSRVKTMLVISFDWQGVIHKEFVPEGEIINVVY